MSYIRILTIALCCCTSAAWAQLETTEALFDSINARLEYMRAVAAYKAQHQLPVEDLVRESEVLHAARQAAGMAGLRPESVTAFFQTQMNLAKIIQFRHRAVLLSAPPAQPARDLDSEIRPALDELSARITQLLAQRVQSTGVFTEADWPTFARVIDDPYLLEQDKRLLFDSLLQVLAD